MQRLAVRQYDLQYASHRPTVLHWFDCDRNFVTWLERLLAPSHVDHVGWIARLRYPVRGRTVAALRVKLQKAVWVGPKPFRHRPFQRDSLPRVEGGCPMMSEYRQAKSHGSGKHCANHKRSNLHPYHPIVFNSDSQYAECRKKRPHNANAFV